MDNSRIVRDIGDGILVLGRDGTILEINPAAMKLLGLEHGLAGEKYFTLMESDSGSSNDAFHQTVLDAISEKTMVHRSLFPYVRPDGTQKMFEVTSAALQEDESDGSALLLSISDRTEETRLRTRIEDSAAIFTGLLCALCGWNFVYAMWDYFGHPFPGDILSKLMLVLLLIPVLLLRRHLHLTPDDMGLRLRSAGRVIAIDAGVTVLCLALLCTVKLLIMRLLPDYFDPALPFVRWDKYPPDEYIVYAISVLLQEILSRGIVHELLRRMMPGRNVELGSILVSSALFGALHIHLGLVYMCSAALLLGALGIVYNRQKSIWGLCIVHYCLGWAIGLLDFVAY